MCGFAGFLNPAGAAGVSGELAGVAARMAQTIAHRGPDGAGAWADAAAGVALGHRRLAILDLSAAGHQPMASAGGRFVIAFNGEIYNHPALRQALQAAGAAPPWRGHSDTETLLAAFEHWGVDDTLARTVGMFALALWDRRERVLHLARDRFGEKPLYYGWSRGSFVFGSELKALRAYPGFGNAVCRHALAQYLRFGYVPAPRSIHQGVFKLEPGCVLSVQGAPPPGAPSRPLRPGGRLGTLALRRWWSLSQAVEAGARDPVADETEALALLEQRLDEAVRLQSLADVPLGAFLSGGVDSSTIVALMQRQATQPVRTFTVGFEEGGFDESGPARAVARHLGTAHTELFVSAAQAREVIAELPRLYDEPFADSSQVPTLLVCRAARRHVTVALSGDAGDEVFGGYNRYCWGPRIWQRVGWMPYPLRHALAATLGRVAPARWDALGARRTGAAGVVRLGEQAQKLSQRMRGARSLDDFYRRLVSQWQEPLRLVQGVSMEPPSLLDDPLPHAGMAEGALRMMYRDSMTYLCDDILCKVDRAAMASSLETRVPFLDHRVVELAWRLPLPMKVRGGQGKWALRRILERHVPAALTERPKAGFAVPIGAWLRGPLRGWAEGLLDEARLRREAYLDPAPVRALWRRHLGGECDATPRLWSVLMFQAWLEARR